MCSRTYKKSIFWYCNTTQNRVKNKNKIIIIIIMILNNALLHRPIINCVYDRLNTRSISLFDKKLTLCLLYQSHLGLCGTETITIIFLCVASMQWFLNVNFCNIWNLHIYIIFHSIIQFVQFCSALNYGLELSQRVKLKNLNFISVTKSYFHDHYNTWLNLTLLLHRTDDVNHSAVK